MTGAEWVAVRLARLAAPAVLSRPRPAMLAPTIRAALLADLALRGALADTGDGLEIDIDPTGFAPADRLLAAIVERPDKQLGWWLARAPVGIDDVGGELVANGAWKQGRSRRYREVRPTDRTVELERMNFDLGDDECAPATVVTAALLMLLPLRDLPFAAPTNNDLQRYGAAGWLMPDLLQTLERHRELVDLGNRDGAFTSIASIPF